MAIEIELHPAQAEVLKILLFRPKARFRDLNLTGLTNDHFTWHLNRLVEVGLVEKTGKGEYRLSVQGKEFANRMDSETVKIEKQAKIAVLIVCVRAKNGKTEYFATTVKTAVFWILWLCERKSEVGRVGGRSWQTGVVGRNRLERRTAVDRHRAQGGL